MLREVRKKYVGKHINPEENKYDSLNDVHYRRVNWTDNNWNDGTSTDYSAYLTVNEEGLILSISRLEKKELIGDDATRVNYRTRKPDGFDYEELASRIEKIVLKEE